MSNMKVTYMNKKSGHGNMGDKHTFIRCSKCNSKYVKETNKACPACGGTGDVKGGEASAIFKAAVEKEVAKKLAKVSAAEADAKIAAEVDAENAIEEAAKKSEEADLKADAKSKK